MGETELERMIVRLVGDSASYQKMLVDAERQAASTAANVGALSRTIEAVGGRLHTFATTVFSAITSYSAGGYLRSAFEAFAHHEQTMVSLSAVVRSHGGDVRAVTEDYRRFAESLSRVSTVGVETVTDMLRKFEAAGLSGDIAKAAARNAVALAAAQNTSVESMGHVAMALAQGRIQMLHHLDAFRGLHSQAQIMAKVQDLIASGMKIAAEQSKTATGQLQMLHNEVKEFSISLGKTVVEAVKPYIQGLRDTVAWLRKLSPETKVAVVTVLALVAAVAALPPIIMVAGVVFNAMFGGVGILVGALVAGAVAVAAWITSIGGVGRAWEAVKETAAAAWTWLTPVGQALSSLWDTILEGGMYVWGQVKNAAATAWAWISTNSGVTWEGVRTVIVNAILMIEFALRNLVPFFSLLTSGIALKLSMMGDDFSYWFTQYLPTVAANSIEALRVFLVNGWESIVVYIKNTLHTVGIYMSHMLDTKLDWTKINAEVAAGMDQVQLTLGNYLKVPTQVASELTVQLKAEFDRQGSALNESWDTFHKRKMAEFNALVPPSKVNDLDRQAEAVGSGIGKAINQGIMKEKFDSVLAASAEAITHLADYKNKLLFGGPQEKAAPKLTATESSSAEARTRMQEQTEILRQIRDGIDKGNKAPAVTIDPALIA